MDSSQGTATAAGGNGIMVSQSTTFASPVDSSATTATAATPIDDPKQNLTQVISSIQKNLGILHQLYLTVSSYSVSSQLPLLQRMNNLVLELDNMTRLAEKCNIQVPMEVLNLIDDGKNPDEFTGVMLNGCIAKNQITKGRTDTFKKEMTSFEYFHLHENYGFVIGTCFCTSLQVYLVELTVSLIHSLFSVDSILQILSAVNYGGVHITGLLCLAFTLLSSLRRHLLEELEQAFPDEVETYREIRAAPAAKLRH